MEERKRPRLELAVVVVEEEKGEQSGLEEENKPVWILPAEIWEIIFNNVTKPHDLLHILRVPSRPSFSEILHPRKCSFLFHFIFPILVDQRVLDKRAILDLRLVSPLWRDAVDGHLQTLECVRGLDVEQQHRICEPEHLLSTCWLERSRTKFHEMEELEAFQEHMRNYKGNSPFITRSLSIGDHSHHDFEVLDDSDEEEGEADLQLVQQNQNPPPPLEGRNRFWTAVLQLLTRYGKSLHSFEFFSTASRSAPDYYCMLLEALELLPNLRKLQIHLKVQPGDILKEHCVQMLESQPLPALPHLEGLKLSQVPSVLLNGFLGKYNGQLQRISLSMPEWHDHLYTFDDSISLQTLTYLILPVRYDHWIWKLEKCNWLRSLKTLKLRELSYNFVSQRRSNLEKLFELVATKSPTLTELELEFTSSWEEDEEKLDREWMTPKLDPGLRLNSTSSSTSIKKLTLRANLFNLNTIDFILGLEGSLRELHVVFIENESDYWARYQLEESRCTQANAKGWDEERYGTLKFFGYWRKLYESNVWELMPKLERISVKFKAFAWNHNQYAGRRSYSYNRGTWGSQREGREEVRVEEEEQKWHWVMRHRNNYALSLSAMLQESTN